MKPDLLPPPHLELVEIVPTIGEQFITRCQNARNPQALYCYRFWQPARPLPTSTDTRASI